jgi:thiamine pyrophosphokinase
MSRRGPHIVIVLHGAFAHEQRLLSVVEAADVVIAADGGANWLLNHRREPDILIGDMDSIAPKALEALRTGRCRLLQFPTAKDETDAELALREAVALQAARITILGALGGRIDHALANVYMLLLPLLDDVETAIFDGLSRLSLVRSHATIHGCAGDLVSLIPVGADAVGVRTEGLQYALHGETLVSGLTRGISNVMSAATAHITVERGDLLLVHTPWEYLQGQDGREQVSR